MGEHSRKGAPRPGRKGCGVGAASTPGPRHGCSGCPAPRSPPSGSERNLEAPGPRSAASPGSGPALLGGRGGGGGAAPRRLPGFLHQPLNTAHKPVAQAFPRTGVAPKGVPGDGGFLLVGSGALTLYHGPRCAPHLSLSPAWTESDISRAPSSGRWSVEPPQVGGGDFRARTLDGEDLAPYPPVSLLVLQSKQKPEPSSPSGTAKELEENAQIANTE